MRSKRPSGTKQAIWRSSKRPFGAKEAEFTASRLLQVIPEFLAAGRVAQLAQRLGLDLPDALAGHPEPLADLFQRALVARLQAQLLEQGACGGDQRADRLGDVGWDAKRPRLVGDGARDGLLDPPRGVGRELVALVVVEVLDRADETHVPFLDEVREGH